jgi:non-canonical purine NTP pyrophosphatase (RdgB/HAM1 family)
MDQILFSTGSAGKLKSLEQGLASYGITVEQAKLDVPEIQADTIREVATEKVLAAYALVNKPVIALDAGFCLDALGGCPGPYTKYFLERAGIEGIIKLADLTDRKGCFLNCLCYMAPNIKEPVYFEEAVLGRVLSESRGLLQSHHWSPIATIFVPDGYDTTLAEMSEEEISEWRLSRSRRRTFAQQFGEWYELNRQ